MLNRDKGIIDLEEIKKAYSEDFLECIEDLLMTEEVRRLDDFSQHCNTSRLDHSLAVAYYSYVIAKRFGWDYASAARAGMLHDLFWYDWRTEKTPQLHAFYHPKNALENAEKLTELNDIEKDAIVKHMWPLCMGFPKYKEGFAVTMSDKYCATVEIAEQLFSGVKEKCKSVGAVFNKG